MIHDAGIAATSSRPAPGRLVRLGVLRFTGADALTYLQGQLSNDTRRLSTGGSRGVDAVPAGSEPRAAPGPLLAAYSTPQGRVVSLLTLLPHSSGVLAILPRELATPTIDRLRKFVMRAKVTIEDLSETWGVVAQYGTGQLLAEGFAPPDDLHPYQEHDGIGVSARRPGATRYWLAGSLAKLAEFGLLGEAASAAGIDNAWRLADIRDGLPQVYAATTETFVAQMLNLDRIDGISFTKGCFTGQEIIARTQHLGRIKRRLFRMSLPAGAWEVGHTLRLADGRTGRLTEVAVDGSTVEALAVLNLDAGSIEAPLGGAQAPDANVIAASELPLPYTVV